MNTPLGFQVSKGAILPDKGQSIEHEAGPMEHRGVLLGNKSLIRSH
ncbi:MAG: hypothetical protein WD623_01920 [Marinobacter sp.]